MGVRQSFRGPPTVDPQSLANSGVVTGWLRLASGTVTTGAYESITDVLNSNPAVQATPASRLLSGTSANGLPIMTGSASTFMTWPLAASNNGATKVGYGMWLRATSTTGSRGVRDTSSLSGGASLNKVRAFGVTGGNQAQVRVYDATATQARTATLGASFGPLNTWQFATVELYLSREDSPGVLSAESKRCVITLDGVVQTLSFSALIVGTTAMPSSTSTPTGNVVLFSLSTAGSSGWVGDIGPNIYHFGGAMADATEGLLTPAARLALKNFEAPT